jgi:hypothetical protein
MRQFIKKRFPSIFKVLARIKQTMLNFLIQHQNKSLKEKIAQSFLGDPEIGDINFFLRSNPVEMVPYTYTTEIRNRIIEINQDLKSGFHYVTINGNNIYYPFKMDIETISESVKASLIEQDERSPHKYLPAGSIQIGGDAAILCGASDGIYTLEIVDKFNKIYLFEANPDWIEPLKITLKKYLDKIEIIPYFISDKDGPNTITLDSFLEGKQEKVNYIQADIEGDELKMLKGASKLISKASDLSICVCCYHTKEQEQELTDYLFNSGFKVSHSEGYLLLWMQYPLSAPYLRRGVLYGIK